MDDIIVDVFFFGKAANGIGVGGQILGQIRFGQGVFRPGGHMHHPVAKAEVVEHVGDMLILGTGEHVHVNFHAPQLGGKLADIHIHPAGVFAAEGGQGASVIGEHGYVHMKDYTFMERGWGRLGGNKKIPSRAKSACRKFGFGHEPPMRFELMT